MLFKTVAKCTVREYYIGPEAEEFGLIPAPKESTVRQGRVSDFSDSNYEAAKQGEFYLRLNIAVAYIDGFGRERTTWKWFEYSRESGEFRECAARQD